MAVGSVAMLLIAAVAMLVTDPVLALVGFVVFPTLAVANIVFQRRVSPAATRAQRARGAREPRGSNRRLSHVLPSRRQSHRQLS